MKVGDYVRTKYGIGKITNIICGENVIFDNDNVFDDEDKEIWKLDHPSIYSNWFKENVIKSSPNIIDLIEVGDYVNGEQIIDISSDSNINNEKLLYYYIPSDYGEDCFRSKDIKSIVTKEQFKEMEYKI